VKKEGIFPGTHEAETFPRNLDIFDIFILEVCLAFYLRMLRGAKIRKIDRETKIDHGLSLSSLPPDGAQRNTYFGACLTAKITL